MTFHFGPRAVLTFVLSSTLAFAQSWDPVKKASGWARVDKDGSIAFYDAESRKIYSWMRDGGIVGELDLSRLGQTPEKWVLDFSFNAWVVAGRELSYIDKNGKNFSVKLPYDVADLAWDAHGFYISYKTPEPYIEMRGYDSGSVVWYIRNRAMKDENLSVALHRIVVTEDKTLYIGSRNNLQMEQVDCTNGRLREGTALSYSGGLAPTLAVGNQERGALAWWLGKNTAVQAIPASQLPTMKLNGLILAMENLTASTVNFVPTGLSERHTFIGMVESDAAFIAPGGGLVFVPIQN